MADEKGFIGRWSRRKLGSRQRVGRGGAAPAADGETPRPGEGEAAAKSDAPARAAEGEAVDPATLPDIETLDRDSDFTAFMKADVPAELKNRALRRLWRMDPSFANLDGLVDYGDDFTDRALVVKGLKTAYRVGRGFLREVADGKKAPEAPGTHATGAATPVEEVEQADVGAGEADATAADAEDSAKRPDDDDTST